MGGEIHQKTGVTGNQIYIQNQARADAEKAKAEAKAKAKAEADAKLKEHFSKLGVDAEKTKDIKRLVNGQEKTVTYGHDSEGKKVYFDAETGEQLVVAETRGKNAFVSKSSLDSELKYKFGLDSAEFAKKNIVAEFKHGKITLTDMITGNRLSDSALAQLEKQHRAEVEQRDYAEAHPEEAAKDATVAKTTEMTNEELATAIAKEAKNAGRKMKDLMIMDQSGPRSYSINDFVADVKSGKLSKGEINEAMKQFGLPQEIAKDEVAKEKAKMPDDEQLKDIQSMLTAMGNDLAATSVSKQRNADGVVVQGTGTNGTDKTHKLKRQPKGGITGKSTVTKEDQAKIDAYFEHQKELQTKKAGKDSLTAAEAVKKGLKPIDNNGSYIYEHTVKAQGDKPEHKVTTVYHKIVVGNSEIYVKQGTPQDKIDALKKAELEKQQKAKKNYEINVANGKNFAKLLHGADNANISDAQLAAATKDLSPQFYKGFMRGVKSEKLIGKNVMTSAFYSKTATPQAKKEFAIKLMTAAKPWADKKNIQFQFNNKTYTCEALLKEIKTKGLTEDLAFIASNIMYQI